VGRVAKTDDARLDFARACPFRSPSSSQIKQCDDWWSPQLTFDRNQPRLLKPGERSIFGVAVEAEALSSGVAE
jgi:hypothetical protein